MQFSSHLNKGRAFSKTFFLGLINGRASVLNLSERPSKAILSPTLDPSGGLRMAVLDLSLVEEHKTIPFDGKPPRLLGLRLVMTHTKPVICSKGITYCSPEAICLTYPSPQSISSHHNLSESGCFQTFFNSPTLMSMFYSKNRGFSGSYSASLAACCCLGCYFYCFSFSFYSCSFY